MAPALDGALGRGGSMAAALLMTMMMSLMLLGARTRVASSGTAVRRLPLLRPAAAVVSDLCVKLARTSFMRAAGRSG
jgi:hypothetical protein